LVPALASKNGSEHTEAQALLDALLQARRQAAFLDDVLLPAQLPDHVTMVLVKRPAYLAAFEGYLEFRRTVSVRLDEPALEAPLENLPYLYQVWGTLVVIEVLLDVVKKYAYKVERQRLVQRDPFGLYVRVLADGEPILVLRESASGAQVKLIPQRTYGRGHGLHSVSYSQIPDIAIEVSSPTRPPRVHLLDPKYRLDGEVLGVEANPDSKPTKVDIDKMHAYRDAIRNDQGNHVVSYAGILYPGPYMEYSQGLEALPAYPGREDALRDRLRVVCQQALAQ
jgi:predicted component of viral defense system (DUF524 family)